MKTVSRKSLLVIAIALVLSLSVGMTFAYFSDHTAAAGAGPVNLGGSTEIVEPVVTDTGKEIQIVNTGDTDVIVRTKVIGPDGTQASGSGWKYDEATDYFYYTRVLKVGETSSKLKASFSGSKIEVEQFDVLVVNDCVMVTYNADNTIAIPSDWAQDFLS